MCDCEERENELKYEDMLQTFVPKLFHTHTHARTHARTHTHLRNWPTFPQVYINGELVGGADIMLQLHQSGELISELERIGHRSILDTSEDSDKS